MWIIPVALPSSVTTRQDISRSSMICIASAASRSELWSWGPSS